MTTETVEIAPGDVQRVPVPVGGDVVATYEAMIDAVPDAGGAGIEGILEAIAQAETADQLDAPWQTNGLGRYANVPVLIQDIAKLEAQFDSPIPWYLVVRGAVIESGETFTATTGSVNVVAQLTQAFNRGLLPWACVLRSKESRTRKGAFVQHLETYRPDERKGGR